MLIMEQISFVSGWVCGCLFSLCTYGIYLSTHKEITKKYNTDEQRKLIMRDFTDNGDGEVDGDYDNEQWKKR